MSDLEQRLRATFVERSEGFEPSSDLPDRIAARVRGRRIRRRLVAGGLAAAAVAVVVGVIATGGDDQGTLRTTDHDAGRTTTTTEDRSTTSDTTTSTTASSTTTTTTSTTTTSPIGTPSDAAIDFMTPLSRQGIGPIAAGMTVRQAEEAGGVTLVPSAPGGSEACVEARFEGFDPSPVLLVEPSGADVRDGVVRAVQASVLPTAEGAIVGQSRGELLAALGSPTRTEDASATWGGGAELLVFEAGGYAYGAVVVNDQVLGLQSGDPDWVRATEGCPA